MYLSWIIPAYNEEKRIEKTLREVDAYLRSKNFPGGYEIIVVDSSSRDKTQEIVKSLQPHISYLQLLTVENRGKGWAVAQGMLRANGNIRLFSDADNSTAPQYFDNMEPLFEKGSDLVISSRDSKDAAGASRDIKEPWYRELLGNAGNFVIQVVGVWGVWDTQNGFKACTAKAAMDIFPRLRMRGFSFDVEMLALARARGYTIAVIPIRWRFDPDSKVKLDDYLKFFLDVFKIRLNFILRRYSS